MTRIIALIAALGAASPILADEVTDTLKSAMTAYEEGDIQYALDELEFAKQALLRMKTDSLGAFLPKAPDGWSVEVNSDMNTGLAMMGGGVGAEANYTGPDGQDIKLTLMADNPMVASMSAMVTNAAAMGMKVERIGRQRFAVQDGQILGLIGNRVLVQTEGEIEMAKTLLETMDFAGLANFGL
ncbi:hypothetical protein ACN2XU_10920 [Primorskyibacter sp. 2E107]|uniref:hypothetical protein n=1 Tax=Primorskyibacter sp. 2E107 TaxID=3403458 RepID=UPI003AF4929A